jgi:DNA polymerase
MAPALRTVMLAGPTDLDGFRRAARSLVQAGVPPAAVSWHAGDDAAGSGDLFAEPEPAPLPRIDAAPADAGTAHVPPDFLPLCRAVVLHADPGRFALLYRLLWRYQHEPALRHDPLDPDLLQANQMTQAVRRDMHKMKAFVRFRRIESGEPGDEPLHVAWFEPAHHIVEAVAPFFMRRFTAMRWAILTPERSVRWDGKQLSFGPGAQRDEAPPPDAGEALWLTYYQHIFNPARLKLAMMEREMPRRYWKNLPEAALIAPLAAQATARSEAMVEAGGTEPQRRIPIHAVATRHSNAGDASDGATAGHAEALDPLGLGDLAVPDDAATPPTPRNRRLTLASLKTLTDRCRECPIGEHATQSVVGEGPKRAKLMLVGEQPGDLEDLQGRPFVGPAGQLLDRALQALGWSREQVFITNAVKHFKFGLRGKRRIHKTPSQREAAACLHWLESEIELVRPEAFVALGATAAQSLLGRHVTVTSHRGQWLPRADGRLVLITLHPSALLRLPGEAREAAYAAWLADLRQVDMQRLIG